MDHQTLIVIVCAVLVGAVFGALADRLIVASAFHAADWQDGYRRGREAGKLFAPFQPQYTAARPFGELVDDGPEPWSAEELAQAQRMYPRTDRRYQVVRLDDAAPKQIEVHRTTIDGSGVQIDENHMLPPEVAARLFGGKRSATHDNFFDEV